MRRTAFIVFLLPLALLLVSSPAVAAESCRAINATGVGSGAPTEPGDPPGLVRTRAQLADAGLLQGTTAAAFTVTGLTDTGISFETICEIPSFLGSAEDAVTRLALRLAGAERTTLVAFGTEAGLFRNAGIRTVVCGPGSIVQAHQPDEFVSLEQLAKCQAFLQGLAATREIG